VSEYTVLAEGVPELFALDNIASAADRTPDSYSASLTRMSATVFEGRETL
jgi:hypothetical protein